MSAVTAYSDCTHEHTEHRALPLLETRCFMFKGVVLYNYTVQGMQSLEKGIRQYGRPGVDLYACYFPQSLCARNSISKREAHYLTDEKRTIRAHFADIQRRLDNRNVSLSFGEFIQDSSHLLKYLHAGAFDFVCNGNTGNSFASQPFIDKNSFYKISAKTDCLIFKISQLSEIDRSTNTLLISNASAPFAGMDNLNHILDQGQFHFKHIKNPNQESLQFNKLVESVEHRLKVNFSSREIVLGQSPIETVTKFIHSQSWKQILFEFLPNSLPDYKESLKGLIKLSYRKEQNLQVIVPVVNRLEVKPFNNLAVKINY